ncbi:LNS2 domain-containing protein [Orenia metallireducens]|uniref:LNS2 domain-containing protein n=1 Tax=Orenia metallireducens TaxID=1413210 RepID=UPI0015E5F339|nr:HAD family acid phosphatase [Orenia metallireducens]
MKKKLLFLFILSCLVLANTSVSFAFQSTSTASTKEALSKSYSSRNQTHYYNLKPGNFPPPKPTETFNNWWNYPLVNHTPHHNGYDKIFSQYESQRVEGKFHYGKSRKDLEGEWISIYVWSFSSENPQWIKYGRRKTDYDGRIYFNIPEDKRLPLGISIVRMYVEGDGTFADSYIQIIRDREDFVVFDIDGTLTLNDIEFVKEFTSELCDELYQSKAYPGAQDVVKYYVDRGYNIIYLTARPYWGSDLSRKWLIEKEFPFGILHTKYNEDTFEENDVYKTNYLNKIINKGVHIERAYGNATTDIDAYYSAGLYSSQIFIIGENSGIANTVPISTYLEHLETLNQN